ncbi:MAG TPA: MFS transporter [Bryobacteraceae bacterium]|nr:MFS transporter [Bryobacteraceae bacterium]
MKYRHRVLGFLFLLSMITYLDRVAIGYAGVRIQTDLGLNEEQWGWILGIFALSYAAFEVPSGAMADRIGARKVLTRIVLWWSAFTALTGGAFSFISLLLTRFFFGAGEAGAYPGSSSGIARWFPTTERARAHGVVWMASRAGGAVAPLLVIPLQQTFGWRTTFVIFGALGLVWCAAWWLWYRDYPTEKDGVTDEEIREIGNPPRSAHVSLPWGQALRNMNLWWIMLMYHFYCWGAYFYLSWLGNYLRKGRGFTEDEMKIYAVLPFLAGVCGNLLGGTISDSLVKRYGLRFGRVAVGVTSLTLAALCLFATAATTNKYAAVAFLTLGYGTLDLMLPVSWAVCLDVGRRYAGAVTGAMNMSGQIGSFISSVAFGYMVQGWNSYNKPLAIMAAMLIVSAILYTRIDPRIQLIDEVQDPAPAPARAAIG